MHIDNHQRYFDAASGTVVGGSYANAGNVLYAACPESRNVVVTAQFNGVNGTLIGSIQHASNSPRAFLYRWIDPPIGTYTAQATYASAHTSRIVRFVSFIGADTSAPNSTPATSSGQAINKTLSITTTKAGAFVVDVLADQGNVFAPASGQTPVGGIADAENRVASYRSAPLPASYSNDWTGTNGTNANWVGIIMAVHALLTPWQQVYQVPILGGGLL
jgi:hypothetical protein